MISLILMSALIAGTFLVIHFLNKINFRLKIYVPGKPKKIKSKCDMQVVFQCQLTSFLMWICSYKPEMKPFSIFQLNTCVHACIIHVVAICRHFWLIAGILVSNKWAFYNQIDWSLLTGCRNAVQRKNILLYTIRWYFRSFR